MLKVQVAFFPLGSVYQLDFSFFPPEITVLVHLSVTSLTVISSVGVVCRAVHFHL